MNIVNKIIEQYHPQNIKIISHECNKGLSAARNSGLQVATGEYIFFMDSDDTLSKLCIETHVKAIIDNDADFTDGNVQLVGTKHNIFNPYHKIEVISKENILKNYFKSIHVCGWNKLIKRDFLIKNQIFFKEKMLYEDILWVYQLCKFSNKYVTIPEYTYFYLIRPGSITTNNKNHEHSIKQFTSFIWLLNDISYEFSQNKDDSLLKYQSTWINKKLFIIKGRLLNAPLSIKEKNKIHQQLIPFTTYTEGIIKLIHRFPYVLFALIFKIPNIIYRAIRN